MKKIIIPVIIVFFTLLVISCEVKTNYTEDDRYGKVIIHNDAGTSKIITRIIIDTAESASLGTPTRYYNEPVSIHQDGKSKEYEVKLGLISGMLLNRYRVTITVDGESKSAAFRAYEDIVNHLYYDGTNLVERK